MSYPRCRSRMNTDSENEGELREAVLTRYGRPLVFRTQTAQNIWGTARYVRRAPSMDPRISHESQDSDHFRQWRGVASIHDLDLMSLLLSDSGATPRLRGSGTHFS